MGNQTNLESWSARERLAHIERLAYWRGWVRRADLVERFKISVPQASADLAAYQRLNKRALSYDLSSKRYVSSPKIKTLFGEPNLRDGLNLLATDQSPGVDKVATIDLPIRHVPTEVVRKLVNAVFARHSIEIHYFSVNSGTESWRWITPHAFAHDGYRWHARAWCHEDRIYKDFVLGRMSDARVSTPPTEDFPPDEEWNSWTTIHFKPHKSLSAVQRRAIEKDFGMKNGKASLRVRKALLLYSLSYLGLAEAGGPVPHRLQRGNAE